MLPDMNLMTDLDLGGKIVQETGVSFNVIILEMVTIKGQSKKKYDQFLAQYASRSLQPTCVYMCLLVCCGGIQLDAMLGS